MKIECRMALKPLGSRSGSSNLAGRSRRTFRRSVFGRQFSADQADSL